MKSSAILILAAAIISSTSARAAASDPTIYRDAERKIEVTYDFDGDQVLFSAHLPATWTFTVRVDGDQNGIWGEGPSADIPPGRPTADHSFGQDQNGTFCSDYILSAFPQDPGRVRVSTDCDSFPSRGSIEIGQMDAQRWATVTLKVPVADLFGNRPEAHLQVCVYDSKAWTCQYTPARPFIIARPSPAQNGGHP